METCRACGAHFEFIEGPNGRMIPAQRVRSVYARLENGDDAPPGQLQKISLIPARSYWVNHFETCPQPNRFSSGRRRGREIS